MSVKQCAIFTLTLGNGNGVSNLGHLNGILNGNYNFGASNGNGNGISNTGSKNGASNGNTNRGGDNGNNNGNGKIEKLGSVSFQSYSKIPSNVNTPNEHLEPTHGYTSDIYIFFLPKLF